MTDVDDIDLRQLVADRLANAHPDVLRELLATFIHTLMGAEADALCGANYGERSTERTNQRNGYRRRQFDTRTGTLDLAIPKLRHDSYFPDWLLERRKRAERALTTVVATCYLLGVSTRRMDKLVQTLGITSLSKSQVSVMAKELDTAVEAFRTRPLDAGPVAPRLEPFKTAIDAMPRSDFDAPKKQRRPDVVASEARKAAERRCAAADDAGDDADRGGRLVVLAQHRWAAAPADGRPLPSVTKYDILLGRETS
jgi:Transposase, Mutator family